MDSLSQLALGAAVGVAVMGRRTAVWKAALWGGVCGTLPDLDAFIDHGDPVRNMTFHRAESHALFWQTVVSLPVALAAAALHGERGRWRRWWLAVWLALVTHPLLDWTTVYGTQLALPFTDHPFALGSMFIIDPLYTLPLLAGVTVALRRGAGGALDEAAAGEPAAARNARIRSGLRWNAWGLALSTGYLVWSAAAQHHVHAQARAALASQGIRAEQVLVSPAPFSTLLWRIVAIDGAHYHEGFRSLLDGGQPITFDRFDRGIALQAQAGSNRALQRMAWFCRGYYKLEAAGDELRLSDLRMGQEPMYTFAFVVARREGGGPWREVAPEHVGRRPDVARHLPWLWRRLRGEVLGPPR